MTLQVSKCCASPMLTRGNPNSTRWLTCNACGNPTDPMVYPFTTVKQMEKWVKARRTTRGIAYTANPNLTPNDKRMCGLSSLGAFLVGCIIGILIFFMAFVR